MVVQCPTCGQKLKAKDESVGKQLRCPGCKNIFTAQAAAGPARGGPAVPGGKTQLKGNAAVGGSSPAIDRAKAKAGSGGQRKGGGGVAVNWGMIVGLVGVLLVVGLILAFVFGPRANWAKWSEQSADANGEVEDFIGEALRRTMPPPPERDPNDVGSRFDNTPAPQPPTVQGDIMFLFNSFQMSYPEWVPFKGMSSEGEFTGRYNTTTGDIEADIQLGGTVLPSGIQTAKGTLTKFTGSGKKDPKTKLPTVLIGGKPMPTPEEVAAARKAGKPAGPTVPTPPPGGATPTIPAVPGVPGAAKEDE